MKSEEQGVDLYQHSQCNQMAVPSRSEMQADVEDRVEFIPSAFSQWPQSGPRTERNDRVETRKKMRAAVQEAIDKPMPKVAKRPEP